ncbi:hypothetical protein [Halobacterium salinarum]|uniref:hypothetical protein n=1 Tax=Halobacterium salinarum TaxID=2242 RepID=UPI002553AFB5|nr:hypothetical protein [Halobacterium salinarum]MDL0123518.1 hypothetical protein [Halobacterium salinarum]
MKRLTELQHDVKNVQDNVLGDLDADDRVRMFLKAAAEGQEDRIEMLRDSAPRYEYETRDLEFTHGAIEAFSLSSMANAELERLYTAMMMYETGRNMHVAAVLLNEALEQLSQGHFTVDEYGNADAPASWPHDYGPQYDPDESRLAGKYRELWEQNDLELAFDTEDRSRPFFAALAADGLLSYRTEVTENFQPAAMARAEKHLIDTVAEFYRAFHTYRRLAEEHLDMTLDEFLQASQTERLPFDDRTGPRRLTEEECQDVLERMQQYIDAYEESQQKVGEVLAEGAPDAVDGLDDDEITATGELMQQYDLDDMVEADVAELAEGLEDSPGF